jgi:endoglucanase
MRRILAALSVLMFCASIATAADAPDAFEVIRQLGRGVNLGNALDAPSEGAWGFSIKPEYFQVIKEAGFGHVRVPIRWSAHAEEKPPYKIEPAFIARVNEVVRQAREQELGVVLNIHHYEEIFGQPLVHRPRFLALWQQIAEHFADQPESVCFELLNEPHDKLSGPVWNGLAGETLELVRKSNPSRAVIIGPDQWNGYNKLPTLKLPEGDRRLIVTFHYYLPFEFTHQGAEWAKGAEKWVGRSWPRSADEEKEIIAHFDTVAAWAKEHKRPIYLGEFGAYQKANMADRARWTKFVREQSEHRAFSWAYWEFGSGFGAYDPNKNEWREQLRAALVD